MGGVGEGEEGGGGDWGREGEREGVRGEESSEGGGE